MVLAHKSACIQTHEEMNLMHACGNPNTSKSFPHPGTLSAHHSEHTHPQMYTTHSLASKQSSPVTTKPTKSSLQIK